MMSSTYYKQSCGCEVRVFSGTYGHQDVKLKYCPKHAAAPEMYDALRALFFKVEITDYNHAEYYEADRVLALADGEGGVR